MGFLYERLKTRLRKFARGRLFVIRAAQIRVLSRQQMAFSRVKRSNIQPLNFTLSGFSLSLSLFPPPLSPSPPLSLCLVASRWRLQPHSQPIPARPLPLQPLGRPRLRTTDQPLQRQREPQAAGSHSWRRAPVQTTRAASLAGNVSMSGRRIHTDSKVESQISMGVPCSRAQRAEMLLIGYLISFIICSIWLFQALNQLFQW